ncbi:MAG: SRPBCC family protein [Ktedonobacteraceae bacterium]|nr:SRPBCC family protein [Ktedonobacteraceae bacterium]
MLVDFAAYPQWQSSVIAARIVSDGPLARGSRIAETRRFFGRTTDIIWEVTTFQPPHTRGFKMGGAFPSTGVMTWETVPEGTRLQTAVTMHARGAAYWGGD